MGQKECTGTSSCQKCENGCKCEYCSYEKLVLVLTQSYNKSGNACCKCIDCKHKGVILKSKL